MLIADKLENLFKRILPRPFTIAVLLTIFTLVLALLITEKQSNKSQILVLLSYWEEGLWNPPLLVFNTC